MEKKRIVKSKTIESSSDDESSLSPSSPVPAKKQPVKKTGGLASLKGKITVAPKKSTERATGSKTKQTRKEETSDTEQEDRERFLVGVVKELSGFELSPSQIKTVLSNLNINPEKDLTDDDNLLIYNVFTEPLLGKENDEWTYNENELTADEYFNRLVKDSSLFKKILPTSRVVAIYDLLPSLENNRINFRIDKDIFRNKPLLGKGLYRCRKCNSDDTEDYEKQTRAADEPMTVFVRCRACGEKFKFN
jgi:DNA-directed RNA polymerase subunit M/transcription elongation factor TFIIS